ncbi:MAG: hypothetical protein COU63_01475 [Candidatus Pacebacteria bacterium CG10_big_fil_rev_8_21_14_0_10_36_11]|nr:iron-sulfur cluster assembly scaffold protein [Candidatus Pacearchaeota archaeon]OIP73742.1 MAG: hypothetical protein AUK08_04245 [Candidatus Pacebacteria bacterium CG2_30_36_39]PIR64672.1 MAG: hypothetical protein COU63_01475 [Candidatus Pacebacteria bacterium CG10_big_fil_rev_8_21_14_0_10_36_11]PJC42741.1 MAG: hypothetical protein CO040_02855 [Candidatus Pacebacteria bacterium CG_4_9_14_0_2_um_filter_36_8]
MSDFYQEALIAEYREPRNQGALVNPDIEHMETNSSCGDQVTITLKLSEDKKTIDDVKWSGKGCSVSQTSMSLLSDKLIGADLDLVKTWQKQDLLPFFGMEDIAAGREKCFTMGLMAVKKAIMNWENK